MSERCHSAAGRPAGLVDAAGQPVVAYRNGAGNATIARPVDGVFAAELGPVARDTMLALDRDPAGAVHVAYRHTEQRRTVVRNLQTGALDVAPEPAAQGNVEHVALRFDAAGRAHLAQTHEPDEAAGSLSVLHSVYEEGAWSSPSEVTVASTVPAIALDADPDVVHMAYFTVRRREGTTASYDLWYGRLRFLD